MSWNRVVAAVRSLSVLTSTALVAVSALGFFGRYSWFLDLFAHFRIQLGLALVVCTASSWILRQSRVAILAGAFALVNFVIVAPQLVYQPSAEARGPNATRLVHANVNAYNDNFEAALHFFRDTDPDVLVIVEASDPWVAALEPLKEELPHVFSATRGRMGVMLMSRYPMTARAEYYERRNPTVVADVETPNGALRVLGTHPRSPATARRSHRRDVQLEAIASFVRGGTEPTVLLGDLNTTPWGHAFRGLVDTSGLRDTSRGVGYQWSWPASFWPLAIPIDHALISKELRLLDRRMGPSIGSDHLPLVVDIAFP